MLNFNSIKVRLEPTFRTMMFSAVHHFNSIKVRLERPANQRARLEQAFQFHKGTIRTSH